MQDRSARQSAVLLGLVLAVGLLPGAAPAAEADPPSGQFFVTLHNGLLQPDRPGIPGAPKDVNLYATCDNGKWSDVWAEALTFNKALHQGRVLQASAGGGRLRLEVALDVASDPWIKGGRARYEINLDQVAGRLEGSFTGTFEGPAGNYEVKGKVLGTAHPLEPVAKGFVPVKPGEHPRLLFRKSDLPELRRRMQTPVGKAILERLMASSDPVALGFLYQLTGDKSYAERAYPATLKVMADRNGGPFALGRFWGYRTSVVGCAYDLCYDAWDAESRHKVEDYLNWILYKCLHRQHRVGTVNWAPGSNYTVVIHAGNGLAALALWGEKGPAPVEPLPPRREVPRLAPPSDLPASGAPVVKLEPGKLPTEWLWIGPFDRRVYQHEHPFVNYRDPDDCLAGIGGMAKARPERGTKVTFGKQTLAWKPLSLKADPGFFEPDFGDKKKLVLNTSRLSRRRENTCLYFYTVLDNDRAGYYEVQAPFYEGRCYLAGVELSHGEIAYLEKGRFPLLVPVAMADGEYVANLTFHKATAEQARGFYADPARQKKYEVARKDYEARLAAWKASGGINATWQDMARTLAHWNYLNLQRGMGNGGFQGEGESYTLECHHVLHDYACAHRSFFGKSVTGLPDISHFAARYVMTTVWQEGRPVSQSFGGHGGGTLPARYLGRSIALCPARWKPALLWYWLRRIGVTAEEMTTLAGARKAFASQQYPEALDLVEAYLHYPLDTQPANPDDVLPHAWHSTARGFFCFRNRWKDGDDIVAQVYAKQGDPCGWNQAEAGCFQIYGLGHAWAFKDNNAAGKLGSRWLDNVVMLPEDPIDAWAGANVAGYRADQATGSGDVTFNMDDVYRCFRTVADRKDRKGHPKRELFDAAIRGVRAFAADYSGKSGAPALFAVVDRIRGGAKKVWVWQLPPEAKCRIDGNSFLLEQGGASLRATFIGPKGVHIAQVGGPFHANELSRVADAGAPALHVTGVDDRGGDFFVVMTLQRGAAPAVKVTGWGLGAVVRIGEQTVRFDRDRILVGEEEKP